MNTIISNIKNKWTSTMVTLRSIYDELDKKLICYKKALQSRHSEYREKKEQRNLIKAGAGYTEKIYCSNRINRFQTFY